MSAFLVHAGACTAVGLDAQTTGFLLRAGFPAMSETPLADLAGEAVSMGWVPTIDPKTVGIERLSALARGPLLEVAAKLAGASCQVRLSIDEDLAEAPIAAGVLESMIGRVMPGAVAKVEPRGESALGAWLPEAIAAVEARTFEAVILGGVHSDYDPRRIQSLEASGRLFSRDNLDGRIPGEAAAMIVVMRDYEAARRGLAPLARLLGAGVGREQARPDNDVPAYQALGMTAAVRSATAPLAESGQTAGWMITDLTPEMRRVREWEAVFIRVAKQLGQPYIMESPAQRIGYLGAAALPLFAAMAVTAFRHGYAPSPIVLAMAGNDLGDRAALTLAKA